MEIKYLWDTNTVIYGFTLITRNTEDFKNIAGLTIINPWKQ